MEKIKVNKNEFIYKTTAFRFLLEKLFNQFSVLDERTLQYLDEHKNFSKKEEEAFKLAMSFIKYDIAVLLSPFEPIIEDNVKDKELFDDFTEYLNSIHEINSEDECPIHNIKNDLLDKFEIISKKY